MDRLEEQLGRAQGRLARASADLDLNEVSVVADKVSAEVASLAGQAAGAAVAEQGIYVAREFREIRDLLAQMKETSGSMAKKAKKTRQPPGKIAILSFSNQAKLARDKMARLRRLQSSGGSDAHKRLSAAKAEAAELRAGVEEALLLMTRSRLKGKIRASKEEILSFMSRTGKGRIFLDHKHLTLRSGKESLSLPFNQVARFCMEDMAPFERLFDNLGKSAVVVGSFEQHNGGARISIGERAVVGNAIVFREKTFLVG
jgi:hypothetical protein